MTLAEERQAAAVRRLVTAYDGLVAAEAEIFAATAEARAAEVSMNRIAALTHSSRNRVAGWLRRSAGDAESTSTAESAPPRIPQHRDFSGPMIPPRHTGP